MATLGVNESLNDIQDYLANFNKEIEGGGSVGQSGVQQVFIQTPKQEDGSVAQHSGIVIQTDGQLTQNVIATQNHNNSHIENSVVQVLQSVGADENNGFSTDGRQLIDLQDAQLVAVQNANDSSQPQYVAVQSTPDNHGNLEILANASQANHSDIVVGGGGQLVAGGGQQQMMVQGENGQFQTVTLVPSDLDHSGEMSYVLIVSQPEEDKKTGDGEEIDMSIYDFKEEPREPRPHNNSDIYDPSMMDPPKRVIKLLPKRPAPGTTQLMCNYCNYTSPKKYLLTRHMKTHSEERPHKCNLCDRGFKTIASLTNHINTHTGTKPHKCKECESAFTTSGELVRHVRYRHTHEKPHKCTECDYCSVELSKLKRHMRSHTGERPYQCPHCAYASADTYKLKRHLRIHTGEKPYECDICHARFTQSNSLKAHRLIHLGNKPIFQCELCPTTCGRRTDLKLHIQKLHTSDKPLQCRKCSKSFPDRYTFKIHMKTHDGEKCFKCELCPYAALSERHLQSHLLTHTGEKPYECDLCDQTFRQKQLLKRHINLYHTPDYVPPVPKDKSHECSECNKVFAHKGNLLRHMALHDPESPMYQQFTQMKEEGEITNPDQKTQNEVVNQGNKTVMIEVTQEGSQQQMFLLMEVPEGASEVTAEQLQQAASAQQSSDETMATTSPQQQQFLDESINCGGELNSSVDSQTTFNLSTSDTEFNKHVPANQLHELQPLLPEQTDTRPSGDLQPILDQTSETSHDLRGLTFHSADDNENQPQHENLAAEIMGQTEEEDEDANEEAEVGDELQSPPKPADSPRRRGRPRKDTTTNNVTDHIAPHSPRVSRSRSSATCSPPENQNKRLKLSDVKVESSSQDDNEIRLNQARKDIEECFGFDLK